MKIYNNTDLENKRISEPGPSCYDELSIEKLIDTEFSIYHLFDGYRWKQIKYLTPYFPELLTCYMRLKFRLDGVPYIRYFLSLPEGNIGSVSSYLGEGGG